MADISQLEGIYGVGNPEAYNQGRNQINIANQAAQAEAEKTSLANIFEQQSQPLKLRGLELKNESDANANTLSGVNSRISAQTEGLQLDAAKMKQVLSASDDQIKLMANQAQQMAYSDDPSVQEKGKRLMQLSALAVEARQKHKDDMEKEDLIRRSAERVAAGNNAATLGAASIGAKATMYSADARKAAKVVDPNVVAAKLGYEKGAAYYTIQAENADTPEEAAKYKDMASRFEQANLNQKNAQSGGKADLKSFGIDTNQIKPVLSNQASAPVPSGIPQGAIQLLRSNPKLAAQFEAKYGAGTSKQILGQ